MYLVDKLNPEKNIYMRSLLYAIGIGGLLHLLTLMVLTIKEGNLIWFNPLFAVDVDKVFPGLKNNPLTFIGGWLILIVIVLGVKKFLVKNKS
jgi:hypothetical protein